MKKMKCHFTGIKITRNSVVSLKFALNGCTAQHVRLDNIVSCSRIKLIAKLQKKKQDRFKKFTTLRVKGCR